MHDEPRRRPGRPGSPGSAGTCSAPRQGARRPLWLHLSLAPGALRTPWIARPRAGSPLRTRTILSLRFSQRFICVLCLVGVFLGHTARSKAPTYPFTWRRSAAGLPAPSCGSRRAGVRAPRRSVLSLRPPRRSLFPARAAPGLCSCNARCVRVRDTETQREIVRDTEMQRDRDRDRNAERDRDTERDRCRLKEKQRQTDCERQRQGNRERPKR